MHDSGLMPNFTFFVQLGIFLLSYLCLRFLVFAPYLSLLEKRKEKTEGLQEKTSDLSKKGEELREKYDFRMRQTRAEIASFVEKEQKRVSDMEREFLSGVKETLLKEVQVFSEDVQQKLSYAKKSSHAEIAEQTSGVVTKLLGRKVSANSIRHENEKISAQSALIS